MLNKKFIFGFLFCLLCGHFSFAMDDPYGTQIIPEKTSCYTCLYTVDSETTESGAIDTRYYTLIGKKKIHHIKQDGEYLLMDDRGNYITHIEQAGEHPIQDERGNYINFQTNEGARRLLHMGITNNPGQSVFPGGGAKANKIARDAALSELMEETSLTLGEIHETERKIIITNLGENIECGYYWQPTPHPQYHSILYGTLYIKVPSKIILDGIATQINVNIENFSVHDDELESVTVVPLAQMQKRVWNTDFFEYCKENVDLLCSPRKPEYWYDELDNLKDFEDNALTTWYRELELPVMTVRDFYDDNFRGIHEFFTKYSQPPTPEFVLGLVIKDRHDFDGRLNEFNEKENHFLMKSRQDKRTGLLTPTEKYPTRFCTQWFSEIAIKIPNIHTERMTERVAAAACAEDEVDGASSSAKEENSSLAWRRGGSEVRRSTFETTAVTKFGNTSTFRSSFSRNTGDTQERGQRKDAPKETQSQAKVSDGWNTMFYGKSKKNGGKKKH